MNISRKIPRLLDPNRSYLSDRDIEKFRSQIIKEPGYSVCGGIPLDIVIARGMAQTKADGFRLANDPIDIIDI